jgi:2-polyprenyl-3-methyl-5-hydroxy-6-metoxy-1,4-benzoquinol methylase
MAKQATSAASPPVASRDKSYDETYYQNNCGTPYERNEHWLTFFGKVADGIVRDLRPTSVFDAGCAMGFLVEALLERGVEAWGADISEYAISKVDESVRDRCSIASLTEPLPGHYDLVTCIEVLEHIPPEDTDTVIANLCAAGDRILLSSTPGDYGEPTHLNVRPPESWAAAFAREGFFRDLDRDASYLSEWATVYVKSAEPVAETVRRYERSWQLLRREATETRASLLNLQERLSKAEGEDHTERSELLSELAARDEELLRLRDHLVGRDAELGNARGQVAELEERMRSVTGIVARLQRIPGFARLSALLRRG